MADIVTLPTGTVTCRLAVTTNDAEDTDTSFDAIAPQGYVYLTPRKGMFPASNVGVIPDVISLVVDGDGWAVMPDQGGSPTTDHNILLPAVPGMTWKVTFDLSIPPYPWQVDVTENKIRVAPFDIPVEAGKTTNIADYIPLGVDPSTGATWVKGDPGTPGKSVTSVRAVDGQAIFTLSDGTDLDPVPLPKGNDGAGIPTGGSENQVPARTSDGGAAWKNVSDLVPVAGSRTNLLSNPSFESGLNQASPFNGGTGGGATATVDTTWKSQGSQSLKITPNGTTGGSTKYLGTTSTTSPVLTLGAGKTYTIGGDFHLETPQDEVGQDATICRRIGVGIIDTAGAINWNYVTSNVAPNQAGTTRCVLTVTIPSDAKGSFIRLGNGSKSTPCWWDALTVEEGVTDGSWFTGGGAGLMSAEDKAKLDAAPTAATVTSGDASTLSSAKSYADTKDAATLAAAKAYTDSHQSSAIRADLISKLQAPLVVSHRGGALVHPEHSMEGYEASMKAGFIPEQDIQFLSDGTPVLCHDATVNRTMVGATGNVSSLNLQQWKACRIKNPVPGGKTAAPLTFEEVLDQLGGRTVLMPEIKNGGTSAETNRCIDMVKERGLDRAVIFQSFTYATVKQVINAGLECVYLIGSTIGTAIPTMQSDGVKWVSPSASMQNTTMQTMIDAGLKVLPYTITTPAERAALPSGCFGYFSNDGWWTEGRMQGDGVPRWTYGEAWPRRIANDTTGADVRSALSIVSGALRVTGHIAGSTVNVDLGHVTGGTVTLPLAIEATFDFGSRALSQARSVGFHVWANSTGDVPFLDSATTGQNGFAFAVRRSGQMQAWEYVNGAAASEIGSAVTTPNALAVAAANGTARMRLEITTTGIRWVHVDSGTTWQLSRSVTSRDYRLGLRVGGTEVIVRDLCIDPNFDA